MIFSINEYIIVIFVLAGGYQPAVQGTNISY